MVPSCFFTPRSVFKPPDAVVSEGLFVLETMRALLADTYDVFTTSGEAGLHDLVFEHSSCLTFARMPQQRPLYYHSS